MINDYIEEDGVLLASQPQEFKLELYKHQLVSIYMLEKFELEQERDISTSFCNKVLLSRVGIFADKTGYGKTYSMVAMILRDKMEWNIMESFDESIYNYISYNNIISTHTNISYNKIDCNLIIANQSIIKQWMVCFNYTPLDVFSITTKKQARKVNPMEYDVIICSPTMFSEFFNRFKYYAWKRFIYDEPGYNKISGAMKYNIIAGFYWFITATPKLLKTKKAKSNYNFIKKIFTLDSDTFNNLIVKNSDEFILTSISLPDIAYIKHNYYKPVYNIVNGIVDANVCRLIESNNIQNAINSLGGNEYSNIYSLIKDKIKKNIEMIDYSLKNPQITDADKEILEKRKEKTREKYNKLQEKLIQSMNENNCPICISNYDNPVLLSCCQNIFCGKCILKWLKDNKSCPMCRQTTRLSEIHKINNKDINSEDNQREIIKTKDQIILDIFNNNPLSKVIITSCFSNSFDSTKQLLIENHINYIEIRGTTRTRNKILDDYRNNNQTRAVFITINENAAGIDLIETTDIIFIHNMNDCDQKQIIGRAQRIGRTESLRVHTFI
jgi:hypothetical protein